MVACSFQILLTRNVSGYSRPFLPGPRTTFRVHRLSISPDDSGRRNVYSLMLITTVLLLAYS